jgi:hypothetical protein
MKRRPQPRDGRRQRGEAPRDHRGHPVLDMPTMSLLDTADERTGADEVETLREHLVKLRMREGDMQ